MTLGPVELVVIQFDGARFSGQVLPALQELADAATVRIIDLLFAVRDEDGTLAVAELNEIEDGLAALDPVSAELNGFLTEDDAERLGASLEPNSSAVMILFESRWTTQLNEAVLASGGRLVLSERIPRAVMAELVAAHDALLAEPVGH